MARLWQFLTDSRVLAVIGIAAFAAFLVIGAESFEIAAIWALLAALVLLALWGVVWLVRAARRKRAASRLTEAIIPSVDAAGQGPATRNDAAVLRKAMLEAINTIKTSKL